MSTEPKPDENRCARCGWPLVNLVQDGCVRGNCGYRPEPPLRREQYYDAERWDRETSPGQKAMTTPAPKPSVRVIEELRAKMERADLAIINNDHTCEIEEGHLYVKRGNNECCVALPQCQEWALYIGALIKYAPALLAVVEAAKELQYQGAVSGPFEDQLERAFERMDKAISALDATGGVL